MRCPFGHDVGDPPVLAVCRLGFPGCACGDEIILRREIQIAGTLVERRQNDLVVGWWRKNGTVTDDLGTRGLP